MGKVVVPIDSYGQIIDAIANQLYTITNPPPPPFNQVTSFGAGWSQTGSAAPVGYWSDGFKTYLQGNATASGVAANSTIFTLPQAYWPWDGFSHGFQVVAFPAASITVNASGAVTCSFSGNGATLLDGIFFLHS